MLLLLRTSVCVERIVSTEKTNTSHFHHRNAQREMGNCVVDDNFVQCNGICFASIDAVKFPMTKSKNLTASAVTCLWATAALATSIVYILNVINEWHWMEKKLLNKTFYRRVLYFIGAFFTLDSLCGTLSPRPSSHTLTQQQRQSELRDRKQKENTFQASVERKWWHNSIRHRRLRQFPTLFCCSPLVSNPAPHKPWFSMADKQYWFYQWTNKNY